MDIENEDSLKNHLERDLILHLVAAHHGYARPYFPKEAFDAKYPKAKNEEIAIKTMYRFVKLHRKYGWWQLAYLEALLKSADALASRDFDRGKL